MSSYASAGSMAGSWLATAWKTSGYFTAMRSEPKPPIEQPAHAPAHRYGPVIFHHFVRAAATVKLNEKRIALCAVRVIILGQVIGDWYRGWDVGAWHGGLDKCSRHGALWRRGCLCHGRCGR